MELHTTDTFSKQLDFAAGAEWRATTACYAWMMHPVGGNRRAGACEWGVSALDRLAVGHVEQRDSLATM